MESNKTLYIRNMVCDRCIMTVKSDLNKLEIDYKSVDLGKVELINLLDPVKKKEFQHILESQGFELLESKSARTIEAVKNIVMHWINNEDARPNKNLSELIADELNHDYNSISRLFSQVEGITIEKFLILQKVEKVKELLFYDERSLSQIAFTLGYSSVNHLSSQFKRLTGMTPSNYKKLTSKP